MRQLMLLPLMASAMLASSCAKLAADDDAYDPITEDPVHIDADYPPSAAGIYFDSYGSRVNGLLYLADGAGPHPTVILLHGYPGNERNLDLAQMFRRAGYNVLFFHYRGAWGSEGEFSLTYVIEDVGSALEVARERASDYRIDADRLILVGHSMGGFAALQGAARDNSVRCVAGLAAADMGAIGAFWRDGSELADPVVEDADSLQMLAGWSEEKLLAELSANIETYSLTGIAPKLAGKSVLLIVADHDLVIPPDAFHDPMVAAYENVPNLQLTDVTLSGDHSFSWSRIKLGRTLVEWADTCGGA